MNYLSKNARLQSYKNFPLFGIPIFRPFWAEKSTPRSRPKIVPHLGEILNKKKECRLALFIIFSLFLE
jgi:hypothetical protein